MSSYLKKTKVYFLVVALFMTFMLIVCSYKFNITERVYRFHETKVNFRVPLGSKGIKNTTIPTKIYRSSPISIWSLVAHPEKADITLSNDSKADSFKDIVNTTVLSSVNDNKTKADVENLQNVSIIIPTLHTKGNANYSLSNITYNPFADHSIGKNWSIFQTTDLTIKPVKLKPTNIDTNKIDIAKALFPVEKNNENKTYGDTLDIGKGAGDIKSSNGLHNKKQRLAHGLRNPDNLKAYLIKLGLPTHIVSEITNGHIGQHPPSSVATVRPDICSNCFRYDFPAILDEPKLCEGEEVYILILISSTVSKPESRDAIRRTWGSVCNKPGTKLKCLFLFGKTANDKGNTDLVQESEKYHDIVQHDFRDTYANLTFKTMTAMKWAAEKCPEAKYVMKTDDDMYVNTELLPILLRAAPSERFMGGVCWGPSAPHRETSSKWYVSFQQYSRSSFPSMCSGTGYVMSSDVVPNILNQSKNIPFFYLEDVYIALCLKKIGIRPLLLQGFHHMIVELDPCNYRNRVITSHGLNDYELLHVWKKAQECPLHETEPNKLYVPRPY